MNDFASSARSASPGRRLWLVAAAAAASAGLGACGPRPPERTGVDGRLTVGPGLLLVERGELHNGTFELGTEVAADGTWSVDLPAPGLWGLHFYVEGFFYLPVAVDVPEGTVHILVQDDIDWDSLGWFITKPADPTLIPMLEDVDLSDDPVAGMPSLEEPAAGTFMVTVNVDDPNGDLSVQILLYVPATGVSIALNPPGPPVGGFYPNGVYSATLYAPPDLDRSLPWFLLAADRGCSMSAILEVTVP